LETALGGLFLPPRSPTPAPRSASGGWPVRPTPRSRGRAYALHPPRLEALRARPPRRGPLGLGTGGPPLGERSRRGPGRRRPRLGAARTGVAAVFSWVRGTHPMRMRAPWKEEGWRGSPFCLSSSCGTSRWRRRRTP